MSPMLQCLESLPLPVGTVVHIHPFDCEAIDWAKDHGVSEYVVVSPDPDKIGKFQRFGAARNFGLRVFEFALTPGGEATRWNRFNVGEADGELPLSRFQTIFPKVRQLDELQPLSIAFPQLLHDVELSEMVEPRILILETSDVEGCLLPLAIPPQLGAFEWIVIKCGPAGTRRSGDSYQKSVGHLRCNDFVPAMEVKRNDPVWPTFIFRRNRILAERNSALREVSALKDQLDALAQRSNALIWNAEELLQEARRELMRREVEMGEISRARDEQARLALLRATELQAVRDQISEMDSILLENRSKLGEMTAARDRAQQTMNEESERAAALASRFRLLRSAYKTTDDRQRVLHDELLKAEAQIELLGHIVRSQLEA